MEVVLLTIGLMFGVIVGIPIGILIGLRRMRKAVETRSVGHLRIDRSEPSEPPMAFLELKGATIESISKDDFIVLKVIDEDYISHN